MSAAFYFAILILIWYSFTTLMSLIGVWDVKKRYTSIARPKVNIPDDELPGVTILRPLKGIDTQMETCLRSALDQHYSKFEVIFCVESATDPAKPVADRLIEMYKNIVDCKVLVGSENHGPNPKVNNLAKGYRAAKYDILWVLDSNAWIAPGTMRRSVDMFLRNSNTKLVHHMPICLSTMPSTIYDGSHSGSFSNSSPGPRHEDNLGAQLDEMFMLTAHSKFYAAINWIASTACVMGKSNLYRRSDLDAAARQFTGRKDIADGSGITPFANYIAEDNMIAEALWQYHGGACTAMSGDSVIQPLSYVSLKDYLLRRVRWVRVRKYMVRVGTLLEPTTESILSGIMGSFATSVIFFGGYFSFMWFTCHMVLWCVIDYYHFHNLISFQNVEHANAPFFAQKYYSPENGQSGTKRPLSTWLPIWTAREVSALPVWIYAMVGSSIYWRNRQMRIRSDQVAEVLS